jgi:hypothetical protein
MHKLIPSEALAATVAECAHCGLAGPASKKIPGWCKACGIAAALAGWREAQPAPVVPPAPEPVVTPPPPPTPRPTPIRRTRVQRVAPLAPWEREAEALVRAIQREEDEATQYALRQRLLWARYTPWRKRLARKGARG